VIQVSAETMRYENLLEAVPDSLVGVDQKGLIRFVNRQTESLFGYDRDELVGRPIQTVVPEPLWQIYAQNRENYFADPRTRSSGLDLELSGLHHDGTEFPINISMSHIDTGDVLLVITAVADVSRQQQAVRNAGITAAILQYSDDAIIGTTLQGTITSWNPAAERMYGYSSGEILGKSLSLLIPKDREGEPTAASDQIETGQHVEHLETTRVRKDGKLVPVSVTVAPILNEDGEVVGASAVHRDVTEQRQAYETAQRMSAIVENSDDAIIGSALDGTVTSWNPAAERMFGYSSQEIIGKPIDLLSGKDQRDEAKAFVVKVMSGQHVEHFATSRVRKNGSLFPASVTVSPIRDPDGAIVGVSMICRDVTQLRQAFETAQRMAAIVESSEDAIIGSSLDRIITSWNVAAERMFGYTSREIIGKSGSLLTHDENADEIAKILAEIAAGQHFEHFATTRYRKDGTAFPLSLSISPIRDVDGAVVGVSTICHDLTEQERAYETAQRMAAIVDNSNDAIGAITLQGIITSWNPAAERLYGYSSQEMVGTSGEVITPKDRIGQFKAILTKVGAGQPVEHLETLRLHKDGTTFPVSLTISPIRDAGGAVVGASVISRDLTELQHAAQYTRSLIEAALDPLVTISPDGKITDVNEATIKVTGVPREALVGSDFSHYFTDPDKAHQAYQQAFAQGSVTDYPLTLRHQGIGTLTDVVYNASVYRDTTGKVLGVLAAARDVSELKQAARYARSLIEAALDPLATISPDGKITDVNKATINITGVPRDKLIGTDFSGYFTDRDKAHLGYQRVFELGVVTDYPLTLRHRDGTLTDVLYNASLYCDANGNVLGVLAVARDAAKLRRQEQLSEQLQEALKSRVVIEQAKGITAQRYGVTIDKAYELIRAHARNNNASMRTVAEAIVALGLKV
jgi:PAS domain S-box-containing protein